MVGVCIGVYYRGYVGENGKEYGNYYLGCRVSELEAPI